MYSQTINAKRVAAANAIYQQRFPHDELTYHSRDEINNWNLRLEEIRGKNGTFTRALYEEEDRWVTNERILCKVDHRYVLSNYGFIKNRTNDIVPFVPNVAQGIALDVLSEMEEDGKELILQFLKARRLGVSTLFQLLIWARMMFTRNINAVIGASSPPDTEKLSSMFLLAAQYTPYWLRPLCTYFNDTVGRYKQSGQAGYWEFQFSTDERAATNRLDLVHGNQEQDIGRSFNPSAFHLTEMAKFVNAERSIDGGLMRAMVPSPKNLGCCEGTGEGDEGWWPDKYTWNKKRYGVPGSGARMRPTFLPWFVGCLSPGSPVVVGDGDAKPIREVVVGDTVRTHSGRTAKVKSVIHSQRTNEITSELWLWGNFAPLSCTRDHPVLTPGGWKPAVEVKAGDFVVHPVRPITRELKTFELNLLYKGRSRTHRTHRTEDFNFEWGKLLGLYLAEGSLSRTRRRGRMYIGGVSIACHAKEVPLFAEIVRAAQGQTPKAGHRSNSKGAELRVNDSTLGRWIDEHFGHRDHKRIPDWVWSCGRDFCKGIVAGYLDGDGHIPDDKVEIAARSVRLRLHVQLRDLIASLGYGWAALNYYPFQEGGKGNRGGWWLHLRMECAQSLREDLGWIVAGTEREQIKPTTWHYMPDKQSIAIQVERNLDGFSPEFYDLEIDDPDHSFTTLQCAVHNCDLYPTATDLVTQGWYQIKDQWQPNEKTLAQADQAKRYVRSNDLLRKHLGANWEMPREQMFFYETNIKEYRENKRLHVWLSEMAADDKSALISNHKSVFDPDLLMRYRDAVIDPVGVFGLKGKCGADEIVPKRFRPIGVDHKQKSMMVTADWTKHYAPFAFEFYPLPFKGYSEFDESGKILIWEMPKHGEVYALSTDNGDGVEEDASVIQVLRKGGPGRCDTQVAEFASSEISGVELWPWALALGTLYSVKRDGRLQQPLVIPETNREGGQRLWKDLELRGWRNVYRERNAKSTSRSDQSQTVGWHMSPQNRDDLILYGSAAIENEVLELNSPELVSEMSSFIKHPNGKKGAAKGHHDDRIIALFLAFHALYADQARATGKDPNVERGRTVPEEQLWPVMSDGSMSNVSAYIDSIAGEKFIYPFD